MADELVVGLVRGEIIAAFAEDVVEIPDELLRRLEELVGAVAHQRPAAGRRGDFVKERLIDLAAQSDGEDLDLRVLRVRDAMPADLRASASGAIVAALAARDDFASATTLLLTLPFGSEWDTRPLIEAALERGKRVALPRVNAGSRMLDLCAVTDVASDAANGFRGIPESSH